MVGGRDLVEAAVVWVAEQDVVVASMLGALLAVAVGRVWFGRPRPRDPRRDFSRSVRREVFARARCRCEYTALPGIRCRRPAEHADHLHPWSRGGATTPANAVASCARHNLTKGDRILLPWTVWALQLRRRRYFPPGADVRAGERYRHPR